MLGTRIAMMHVSTMNVVVYNQFLKIIKKNANLRFLRVMRLLHNESEEQVSCGYSVNW